uniref:NADH-ubiquinone oxidoreductase chain 5 n=1 Tax=Sipalinus gigas TaxID=1078824 RepID=A0A7H1DNR2_9CUCU|nr:NADH dehydrogenase subunit 5 [Sipalinus gigas]QNS38620.1 NADH dehydrogenase subunit 5 [Sipalinus gigas]
MLSICKVYFYLFMFFSFNLFFFSLYLMSTDLSYLLEFNILSLNSVSLVFTVLLDWMSLLFMSFVLFISAVVINYSEEYMMGDVNLTRFILLVVMFVLSMMLLIISPNLVSILLGWDGLGLVSYALVIYYQNVKSSNAGMLTALTNRIGDVALLMSIAWMLNFGSWNYVFYLEFPKDGYLGIVATFVVLAAITKSAQIPFSSWLPAAMAAPTPVSALVHSSTLVTAGVYLLIRFNAAFSGDLLKFLLVLSMMTMFMAGLGANFEYDLKKIIALSTLSQLGLMISILCLGSHDLAFFHLLTHALFKALLFMCAGAIIHSLGNCQDIRYMGGLVSSMPLTCAYFNICNFALCGLPFLSGFYSKDLIVESMSMGYLNMFVYVVFYLSVGLTACYSFRLVYYCFTGEFNLLSSHGLSDEPGPMLESMGILIFMVIFGGSLLMWLMFPTPVFICLPFYMKVFALGLIFLGMWVGYEASKFYLTDKPIGLLYHDFSSFSANMWNLTILSTFGVSPLPMHLGSVYLKGLDQGWLEYYGSQNLYKTLKGSSMFMQLLSRNHMKVFLMLTLFWLMFLFVSMFIN